MFLAGSDTFLESVVDKNIETYLDYEPNTYIMSLHLFWKIYTFKIVKLPSSPLHVITQIIFRMLVSHTNSNLFEQNIRIKNERNLKRVLLQ